MKHARISYEQAEGAMKAMASMAFFPHEPEARNEIVDSLLELVNPKDPTVVFKCKYGPTERLELFRKAFRSLPKGWPGIGEMEAIYCMMFPPGDGIERGSPATPGYTFEDNITGNGVRLFPREPEPDYKQLAAGEQMTPEEHKQLVEQFTGVLDKMRVKQDANA